MWGRKCGEWQLEEVGNKEYVRTWTYFFHSYSKKYSVDDEMGHRFQKNDTSGTKKGIHES